MTSFSLVDGGRGYHVAGHGSIWSRESLSSGKQLRPTGNREWYPETTLTLSMKQSPGP